MTSVVSLYVAVQVRVFFFLHAIEEYLPFKTLRLSTGHKCFEIHFSEFKNLVVVASHSYPYANIFKRLELEINFS